MSQCRNKERDEQKKNNKNEHSLYTSFISHDSSSASFLSHGSNDFYIDSGSTSHMTKNKTILTNACESTDVDVVTANKSKMHIKCTGDINLDLITKSKNTSAILKNVQYSPVLCANLVSVGQLAKRGKRIVFEDDWCKILDKKQNIGTSSLVNNLYKLNCEIDLPKAFSATLWHRRLGHICNDSLNNTKNAVNGINFSDNKNKTEKCITCIKGKQTRQIAREAGTRAKKLLQLIHSNVCGPIPNSDSGYKYFVSFVDDYS